MYRYTVITSLSKLTRWIERPCKGSLSDLNTPEP